MKSRGMCDWLSFCIPIATVSFWQLHQDLKGLELAQERRAEAELSARVGQSWSYHGTSREWDQFARAWNEIVFSLRSRDMISNAERDDLLFETLDAPEHRATFEGVYNVLPTMLSSPIFTSRESALIVPSTTRLTLWLAPAMPRCSNAACFALKSAAASCVVARCRPP